MTERKVYVARTGQRESCIPAGKDIAPYVATTPKADVQIIGYRGIGKSDVTASGEFDPKRSQTESSGKCNITASV